MAGRSYYLGNFHEGTRHGKGYIRYASGNYYQGDWKLDRKSGEGVMVWLTMSQTYTGTWLDDHPHGSGEYTWGDITSLRAKETPDGPRTTKLEAVNRYMGEFKHGIRDGDGAFFYSSGAVYDGPWSDNRKHGQGKYVFDNGSVYRGEFDMDRMAQQQLWLSHDTSKFELPIDDLLIGLTPQQITLEKQAIFNILQRYQGEMLNIYHYYASLELDADVAISAASLRISLGQVWQLIDDISIINVNLGYADINRLVHYRLLTDPDHATRRMAAKLRSVHDSSHTMLVREFAEVLIRIAHAYAVAATQDPPDDEPIPPPAPPPPPPLVVAAPEPVVVAPSPVVEQPKGPRGARRPVKTGTAAAPGSSGRPSPNGSEAGVSPTPVTTKETKDTTSTGGASTIAAPKAEKKTTKTTSPQSSTTTIASGTRTTTTKTDKPKASSSSGASGVAGNRASAGSPPVGKKAKAAAAAAAAAALAAAEAAKAAAAAAAAAAPPPPPPPPKIVMAKPKLPSRRAPAPMPAVPEVPRLSVW
jgi:hypothetical protein